MPAGMRRMKSTICKWVALLSVTLLVGPFLLKSILLYNHPSHKRQHEFVWVRKGEVGNGREPLAPPDEQSAPEMQNRVEEAPHPGLANVGDGKIDWHDYEAIKREESRKGPGEHGIPYKLSENLKGKRDALFNANGFNALASDQIAMDRSIPDIRHKDCKRKKYLAKLPSVSVVIPFHEEHWTTLLRSVHSILNRSPAHLIKEIILVDDHSTKDFLHDDLEAYLKVNATKTRVVRTEAREGLIRARLLGARESSGDVIIFLDSHIECNVNWLPPLLEPIAENPRTVVCPFIDVIAFEDFEYRAQDEGARGAFDWEFFYKRLPLLPRDLENPTEPFESPVMAGGLFAINRDFFWELGGYDEGLMIWGGEQYELSFKIWQCGGRMVDAPCSRIGHIYRKFAPFPNPGIGDFVGKNYRRVAEVWMDEYAQYLYSRRPNYLSIDTGDLRKQKELRQSLKCKPFKWFMEKVAFDLPLKYPMIEPPDYANGEVRNVHSNLCLDSKFKDAHSSLGVDTCIKDDSSVGGEQLFSWGHKQDIYPMMTHDCLDASSQSMPHIGMRHCHGSMGNQWWIYNTNFEWTWHRDIKPKGRELCLDVATSQPKSKVLLYPCHGMKGNQWWTYVPRQGRLYHPLHKMCLDHDPVSKDVFINDCMDEDTQNWKFESYNLTIIDALPH